MPLLKLFFVVAVAAVAGCASSSVPKTASAAAAPLPFNEPLQPISPPVGINRPSITKAYYVGRIVDAQHPELMHGAGLVFRREQPEAWNTASDDLMGGADVTSGPIRSARNGAERPTLTAADAEIHQAREDEVLNALLAQNSELMDKLAKIGTAAAAPAGAADAALPPAPKPGLPAQQAAVGAAPPPAQLPLPSQTEETIVTIAPSADNVIELSPALLEPPVPSLTNPFRQRFRFETKLRETTITVTGLALGPEPSCTIGDRIYNIGDTFETFTIHAIDADGIFLRKASFLLRIPMQEEPILLRYP